MTEKTATLAELRAMKARGEITPPAPDAPAQDMPDGFWDEAEYQPIRVSVVLGDLRHLCKLAREAGEELQASAEYEYPGDQPYYVRKRKLAVAEAQAVIDAANALDPQRANPEGQA